MKKRSINSLKLNKKTISTVKISSSTGGDAFSTFRDCQRHCIFSLLGGHTCVNC